MGTPLRFVPTGDGCVRHPDRPSMIAEREISDLLKACKRLPQSNVSEEEAHVFQNPVLILMSTVLSLNRRWYLHALPARLRFEQGPYVEENLKTLIRFQSFIRSVLGTNYDYLALSQALWKTKEKDKARQLALLVDYFVDWHRKYSAETDELSAAQKWAKVTPKESFLGRIKGLGPRAYEQLLWYLEGRQAVKLDRHVVNFVNRVLDREVPEEDATAAIREVAHRMGISARRLDSRIWDYMQSGGSACGA